MSRLVQEQADQRRNLILRIAARFDEFTVKDIESDERCPKYYYGAITKLMREWWKQGLTLRLDCFGEWLPFPHDNPDIHERGGPRRFRARNNEAIYKWVE